MTQPTQAVERAGGWALIVAGLLFALASPFHPDNMDPAAVQHPAWTIVHIGYAMTFGLAAFGVIGYYLSLGGVVAGVASALGFVGGVCGVGVLLLEAYALPLVASLLGGSQSPFALLLRPEFAPVVPFAIFAGLLGIVGFAAVGLTAVRATHQPTWAGAALAIGMLVSLVPVGPVTVLGQEIAAAGFVGIGLSQRRQHASGWDNDSPRQPSATVSRRPV